MKKSSLTTAVLAGLVGVAGFAGSANAVDLNPDGTGQALIYPYYTARAGQQTYISVVNSTDTPQAVKVRFLEGYASKEVRDFNLFLSPYDVWTGTIFKLSDAGVAGEGAAIGTRDTSCTVPLFPSKTSGGMSYVPFTNLYYTDSHYQPDKGPSGLDRTNEGYVELIAMSDILDDNGSATAITHVPQLDGSGLPIGDTGVPPGCAKFQNTLDSIANTDLTTEAPAGGLFGGGAIVDVANGTYYAYNADAIDGFTAVPLFSTAGSTTPNLTAVNTNPATGEADAYVFQKGVAIPATFTTNPIDAVSAVFDASALMNEWIANAANGQGTDWVVTFPTKRYYVNAVSTAMPPFVEALDENFDGASCVAVGLGIWDREEGAPGVSVSGPIFSPAPIIHTETPSLCHEVNVVSISAGDTPVSVLGSQYENSDGGMGLAVNVQPFGTAGWLKIDFVNNGILETHQIVSDDGVVFNGLPATGFAAERLVTGDGTSALANYAGAFRHRVERNISAATP